MTINQLKMIQSIGSHPPSETQALRFNQYTFGRLCKNKIIDFNAQHMRFFLTDLGIELLHHFNNVRILYRQNNNGRFSQFVSRGGRGRGGRGRRKVIQMREIA